MVDWIRDVTALLDEADQKLYNDPQKAASLLKRAYETLSSANGFMRINPKWRRAVELYQEKFYDLEDVLLGEHVFPDGVSYFIP